MGAFSAVDIYILDSGLDLNKIPKEFPRGERLTDGHCTIDGEAVNTDKSGHGTWMAAIAGKSPERRNQVNALLTSSVKVASYPVLQRRRTLSPSRS